MGASEAEVLRAQIGEEVHLQRIRQLCRGPEREVDVAREDLCYIRARHLHAPRELCLRHPQLLHPEQNAAKERRTNFIYCGQWNIESCKF